MAQVRESRTEVRNAARVQRIANPRVVVAVHSVPNVGNLVLRQPAAANLILAERRRAACGGEIPRQRRAADFDEGELGLRVKRETKRKHGASRPRGEE